MCSLGLPQEFGYDSVGSIKLYNNIYIYWNTLGINSQKKVNLAGWSPKISLVLGKISVVEIRGFSWEDPAKIAAGRPWKRDRVNAGSERWEKHCSTRWRSRRELHERPFEQPQTLQTVLLFCVCYFLGLWWFMAPTGGKKKKVNKNMAKDQEMSKITTTTTVPHTSMSHSTSEAGFRQRVIQATRTCWTAWPITVPITALFKRVMMSPKEKPAWPVLATTTETVTTAPKL